MTALADQRWWRLTVWHWRMMPYMWRLPVAVWHGDPDEARVVAEIDARHQHRP